MASIRHEADSDLQQGNILPVGSSGKLSINRKERDWAASGPVQGPEGTKHSQAVIEFSPLGRQVQGPRPLLLFDLNGVLLQHHYLGIGQHSFDMRPGLVHILRLLPYFRLGIFTSSTHRTVLKSVHKLHAKVSNTLQQLLARRASERARACDAAASLKDPMRAHAWPEAVPAQLFELVLTRDHCKPASAAAIAARGGNPWDTVKPLAHHFPRLDQVLLIDDSLHKAAPGEALNMIVMPGWAGPGVGKRDDYLPVLVEALLDLAASEQARAAAGKPPPDLRRHSGAISARLAELRRNDAVDLALHQTCAGVGDLSLSDHVPQREQ